MSDPAPPPGFTDDVNAPTDTATTGTVSDTSQALPPEAMTPRFKAADEAMARSAHLIATLPYRSPQYQAAVEADKHIEAEYNAAKAEALALHTGAQPGTQGGDVPPPPGFTDEVALQQSSDPGADPLKAHGLGDELGIGARAILHGAAALPDALAAVGDFVNPATYITGHHTKTDFGSQAADALSNAGGFATPQTDNERLASAAISGATGGLLTAPLGGEGAVPAIMSTLSGGAGGGASELARQGGAGPIGQLAAGIAGGFLAPGAIAVGGRVAQSLPGMAERELSPTMQAFERQNVPAMAADVGGVVPKVLTAGANATLGTIPLHNAGEAAIAATKAARGNVAQSIGRVGDDLAAGATAQSGAKSWLRSSEAEAGRHYDAIPIDGARSAVTGNTRAALAEITRGFESNPELSRLWAENPRLKATLQAVTPSETAASRAADLADAQASLAQAQQRATLTPTPGTQAALADARQAYDAQVARQSQRLQDGSLSWDDMKRLRSTVGEIVGKPGIASDGATDAAMRKFYGALTQDMQATAQAEGPQAAVAFNRANSFWRKRQQTISDVIEPILGKDRNATGQDAFRQIQSWASNNGSFVRTAQLFKALPEQEANAVRASIFDRLGNSSAGRQDAAGEAFSPAEMLTQWNKLDPRVKNLLFGGDKYQQDINDILTIAQSQKSAGKFANTSKTGLAMHAAPGLAMFHSIPTLALQYGAGWILAHPAMARWLASSVKKPNAAAQMAHIDRLTSLAAKQPAIANDVLSLQQRLREGFAQAPQPLAAQPSDQGDGQ